MEKKEKKRKEKKVRRSRRESEMLTLKLGLCGREAIGGRVQHVLLLSQRLLAPFSLSVEQRVQILTARPMGKRGQRMRVLVTGFSR